MNFATKPIADTKSLEIARLRLDGGTQPRAEVAEATVDSYVEALADGAEFPAVVVFYDGHDYWLADGFHRVAAARKANRDSIAVEIHQGSQRDAILYSVGANATHGLPRTNADKHRAVERLLRDPEWSGWSDNAIAKKCSVSQPFVSKVRASIGGRKSNDGGATYNGYKSNDEGSAYNGYKLPAQPAQQTRLGADGKIYNTTNIGKKAPAPAPLIPEAKPAPEPETDDDGDDDNEEKGGDAPLDGYDADIPIYDMTPEQRYEHALKLAERVKELVSRMRKLHNDWQDLCKEWRNDEDVACLMFQAHVNQDTTSKALSTAFVALKQSLPEGKCPRCNGSGSHDTVHACDACHGSGWLNAQSLEQVRGALRVAAGGRHE